MNEKKRILYLVVIFSLVAFSISSSINPLSETQEPLISDKTVNPLQKMSSSQFNIWGNGWSTWVTIYIEQEYLVNVSKSTVLNVSIYSDIPADTRYILDVEVDGVFSHSESIILQYNVFTNRSYQIMFEDTGVYVISASVHSPDNVYYWSISYGSYYYTVYTDIYFDIIQDYYEYQNDVINSYTTDIEFAFADFALLNHTWNFEVLLDDGVTNTSVFKDDGVTMVKHAIGVQNMEAYFYPSIGVHEVVTVNFNHTGYYDVWFVAYDVNASQYYYDWCYYDVYPYDYAYYSEDDWLLVLSQSKEGVVNDDPTEIMFGARFEGDYNASVYFDLIVSNGTLNTTYYSDMHNFTIGQSRWYPSKTVPVYVPITFTDSGYYDVWLIVKNATNNETLRVEYCWFDIYEFEFDFIQDTTVRLYEDTYMDYTVSLGSSGSSFNCTVDVLLDNGTTNTTLFNNSHEVEVGNSGYDWRSVILNQTGVYQVWFIVNDTTNDEMYYFWCYYIVEESLEIDIFQENHVYVDKKTTIDIDIENWAAYYYYNISVELLLDDGTSQTTLYKNDSLIIDGKYLGDYEFNHGIEFFFNETSYYDVILRITDLNSSTVWEYYCWYEVEEVFELWIDQVYDAMVGEEEDILFGAKWHDYSQKANFSIQLLLDNGTVNTTLYNVSKYSFLNSTDDFFEDRVSIVFNETGYYDVWFIMTDLVTGEIYWDYCWWYVEEISVYLDQEYFIEFGESAGISFGFDTMMYGDSFFDVFVNLIDEAGVEYLVFEQLNFKLDMSSCGEMYSFSGYVDYLFSAAGYYDVLFEIYDVTNGWYWEEWCWFYVYEYDELDIYYFQEYDVFVDVWTALYVGMISPVFAVYEVEVLIDDGINNDSVLYNPYVVLTEEDPGVTKEIEHVFRKVGHYKVWLIYTDVFTGEVVVEECYFDVHHRRWEDIIPDVTITGIVSGTTYAGTVNVGVSVTDESKVVNATINIKGTGVDQTYNIILNLAAGTWTGTFALDTTVLSDGSYTVTIDVFDEWGNKKTIVFTITIDNPDPTTTAPPTTTVPPATTTTTTSTTTIAGGPGFELPFVLLSLLGVFVFLKRRKYN